MSIIIKYEPGFYENLTLHKKTVQAKKAEVIKPPVPEVIEKPKPKKVDFESIRNENLDLIDKFGNRLIEYENSLNALLIHNNQLLSVENFRNLRLSNYKNKIKKENCGDLQLATIDFVVNLKPELIEEYKNIKNKLEECERKLKLV